MAYLYFIVIGFFLLCHAFASTETVITQLNCSISATGTSNCFISDALCTSEGFCIGSGSCSNTDCSRGSICGAGEQCWQIYNTSSYRCCSWRGSINTTGTNSTCVDLAAPGRVSDCSANANLCQNPLYLTLMQEQCRKTCGYCTPSRNGTACVDKATSGRPSDCPTLAFLCGNSAYDNLMTIQCPKTCGRC